MAREYESAVRRLSARRVVDYFDQHPRASSGQIGQALSLNPAYVRVALKRNDRRLARSPNNRQSAV